MSTSVHRNTTRATTLSPDVLPPVTEARGQEYDAQGAMQYIVAVVIIYGVGVLGVFILSFFGRRRKKYSREMDNQANYYLKKMRKSRDIVVKEERRAAVKNFLTTHFQKKFGKTGMKDLERGLIGVIGLPLLVHEQTCKRTQDNGEHAGNDILTHIISNDTTTNAGESFRNDEFHNFSLHQQDR